jgi:LmbE family N-acetylglucosaminyl deacetylase
MDKLDNKKVLCIFAHREDHVVCGWPIMQNERINKHLLVCSKMGIDDLPKQGTNNLKVLPGLDLTNGFTYVRNGAYLREIYGRLCKTIAQALEQVKPDYLFTHNPFGEYGHYDHRILFETVHARFNKVPTIITDLTMYSACTFPLHKIAPIYQNLYNGSEFLGEVEARQSYYRTNAELYRKYLLWTLNPHLNLPLYPTKKAKLYLLKQNSLSAS